MSFRLTDDGVIESVQKCAIPEVSLAQYLERVFLAHSQKTALVNTDSGEQYTYSELLEICKSIAAVLQTHGVKPEDLVVFSARTTFRSCCVFLALAFCHASVISAKHSYTEYEFGAVLGKISPLKVAVADTHTKSKLQNALRDSNTTVVDIDTIWRLEQAASFERPPQIDPRTSVALMVFTSGSTGPSKAVCLTHYNLIANSLQWTPSMDDFLIWNPISHLGGIICLTTIVAKVQRAFVAAQSLPDNLDRFVDVCHKYQVRRAFLPPALLSRLASYAFSDKLAAFESAYTGGSKVPKATFDQLRSLYPHIRFRNFYGLSECCVALQTTDNSNSNSNNDSNSNSNSNNNSDDLYSMTVLPNVEVKIVDLETRETLGPHQNGMLYCRSPCVSLGYYNNKQATEEVFVDGWHITGDMAYRDDKGHVVFVERLKQMIKCQDCQVAPGDLEDILSQDKDVSNVVVGGVPHPTFGEAAAAFVVPQRRSLNDLDELRRRLLQRVETKCAVYKHLHGGLYFLANLLETDSGKFNRKSIVEMHLKNELNYLD